MRKGVSPVVWIFLSGFILVSFCCPPSSFGQGQQPLVTIDFEQFSAPVDGCCQSPTLNVGSATFEGGVGLVRNQATWSLDQTNVFANPWPTLDSPGSQQPGDSCRSRQDGGYPLPLEIDFHEKVSSFSAVLLNSCTVWYAQYPITYTVCDDQGGSEQITLPSNGGAVISLPDSGIRRVDIFPTNDTTVPAIFAIDSVQFRPTPPVFLDPVDSGFLNGAQVTTNTGLLASRGVVVSNVAADGVTEAVVRIPANYERETLKVTVQDENGNPCSGETDVANDGGVFLLGDGPGSADCTADVTAVATTSNGPMAFVVYRSPVNFSRNSDDYSKSSRALSLKIQSDDDPNYILTANASVIRPPVELVHGLWGGPEDWNPFTPLVNDPQNRFFIRHVDYYGPFAQGVTSTYPSYSFVSNDSIRANTLGFSYNSHPVDTRIRRDISDFKHRNNAAAVRADVVAHSMGGDIVRTLALEPAYLDDATYGLGPINKLITIGTPHLGTPLASDLLPDPLLGDPNECVRNVLAVNGKVSFTTVWTTGGMLNGAVNDLQPGSLALQFFNGKPLPFAMAMLSATENDDNLSGLDCTLPCNAAKLRKACNNILGIHDPLAVALTRTGWSGVFPGDASDAVVPLKSQQNGRSDAPIAPIDGIVHSAGMEEGLNFNGPQELDYPLIPATVISLLNESPNDPDFQ